MHKLLTSAQRDIRSRKRRKEMTDQSTKIQVDKNGDMEDTQKIWVNEDHIRDGSIASSTQHPMALAIKDHFGSRTQVRIGSTLCRVDDTFWLLSDDTVRILSEWDYLQGHRAAFEFELDWADKPEFPTVRRNWQFWNNSHDDYTGFKNCLVEAQAQEEERLDREYESTWNRI